jgi:hypothetical protein
VTRSFQAKSLILAVFVVGALTGVVVSDLYRTRVQSPEGRAENRPDDGNRPPDFEDFLALSAGQREQLDGILKASRERYRELQSTTRPMYQELTVQSQDEIRAILNEDQLARYEEWIEIVDRRRGRGPDDRDRETR